MVAGCAQLDRDPPVVTVEGPSEPVRTAELVIHAEDTVPGLAGLTVTIDGGEPAALVVPADGKVVYPVPDLPDGAHELRFTATDRSWTPNVTTVVRSVVFDRTPPVLEVSPASATAYQGRTWALWVRSDEPLVEPRFTITARDDDRNTVTTTLPLYPVDGAWRGLRGIELQEPPASLDVVIEASDALGNAVRLVTQVAVAETTFEEGGFIKLSKKQVAARKDDVAIKAMRAERNAAYNLVHPDQRWTAHFVSPIPGAEQTSPFGKYRSYSDGRKSHHTGLDLSEARGTPVASAGDGLVVVANPEAIFGNVVIVHHGHGVVTSYNHLDRIDVKIGDGVKAGQVVGALGSTGQSTGPHLHWGMEVGAIAVDPGQWLGDDFSKSPFPDR